MNYLFHGFEFICVYIDDLLVLTKGDWIYHAHKIELTINKLRGKGMKYNIKNYFFVQTQMIYLGFWVIRYGVKPIYNKIQAIIIRSHQLP